MTTHGPTVLVTDGDYDNAVHVATELARDLDATVVGLGTTRRSRLFRSRFCDRGIVVPPPGSDGYAPAVLDHLREIRPDAVVPVGYHSAASLIAIRDRVPDHVAVCLPTAESFAIAEDKRRSMDLAEEHGVGVPSDYTETVRSADRDGRPADGLDDLPFPVFLKARRETGSPDTAVVRDRSKFWSVYDDLRQRSGEPLLVQEFVDGDDHTYACGMLFIDGSPELVVGHEETRSIPRHGGSGTRVRLFYHPRLEAMATRLLEALEWNGVALVEFKRRRDGRYVLAEINPKIWASYALASQCGYRFVSKMVAETCDLPVDPVEERPARSGERVFPLRELAYWLGHRDEESLVECLSAMLWPPTRPDVNLTDPWPALTPPASWTGRPGTSTNRDDPDGDADADADAGARRIV